jgi:hypothetical protein
MVVLTAGSVFGLELPDDRLVFLIVLGCHVTAGMTATVAGVVAMLAKKRAGRHPAGGRTYLWALGTIFATAAAMVALRWPLNLHLLLLGTLAFGSGLLGYLARRHRRTGWRRRHLLGMSCSYVLMLTAFYVDNGPRLPVWNLLPDWAFWILPAAVGAPLVARAWARNGGLRPAERASGRTAERRRPPRRGGLR